MFAPHAWNLRILGLPWYTPDRKALILPGNVAPDTTCSPERRGAAGIAIRGTDPWSTLTITNASADCQSDTYGSLISGSTSAPWFIFENTIAQSFAGREQDV